MGEEYFLERGYNRIIPPNEGPQHDPDNPIEITLEIGDLDILEVNDLKFSVTMQMYLGIHWADPRIVVSGVTNTTRKTPLDLKVLEYLWTPDLDIYHIKQITGFKALRNLAGREFILLLVKPHFCYRLFHTPNTS